MFDGILPRNVGTDRVFINVRFADPNTYSAQDNHHDFLQNSYPPFTYGVVTDPISGIHDGIMKRPKTDPVVATTRSWSRKIDGDGIENVGIRPMQARVPLGTGTGWNIRKAEHRGPDLCGLTGSYLPLVKTKAEREVSGDSRPSLEERYGDHKGFVKAVEKAANELVNERFLLRADADTFISAAKASDVWQ